MARALDPELLAEARRIQLRADRMVTDVMSGGYSSVFRGSGIEFDEVREFAEGDELRSVDWNVTARAGRPFVKKFVEERELTVMFLLDASSSMAFGTRPADSSGRAGGERRTAAQTAATFVGCVAFAAARNNDKAGLVTFADEIVRYVPAKKGRNHVLRLIREACEPPESRRATDLSAALDYVGRVQKKRAIVFVVSDFLGDDVLDCRRELRLLAKRHEVIAVRLRDPLAAGLDAASGDLQQLPNAGLLHLMDPETGERIVVDSSSRRVREQVAEQWLAQRESMLELCRRSGVDLLDVPTEGSVAEPLVRFFRMRELRGARR
ncbi:MAG: DUF58 domain-containing protein [Planctomycetota bacterium]